VAWARVGGDWTIPHCTANLSGYSAPTITPGSVPVERARDPEAENWLSEAPTCGDYAGVRPSPLAHQDRVSVRSPRRAIRATRHRQAGQQDRTNQRPDHAAPMREGRASGVMPRPSNCSRDVQNYEAHGAGDREKAELQIAQMRQSSRLFCRKCNVLHPDPGYAPLDLETTGCFAEAVRDTVQVSGGGSDPSYRALDFFRCRVGRTPVAPFSSAIGS
jgi:hypothetical protein